MNSRLTLVFILQIRKPSFPRIKSQLCYRTIFKWLSFLWPFKGQFWFIDLLLLKVQHILYHHLCNKRTGTCPLSGGRIVTLYLQRVLTLGVGEERMLSFWLCCIFWEDFALFSENHLILTVPSSQRVQRPVEIRASPLLASLGITSLHTSPGIL